MWDSFVELLRAAIFGAAHVCGGSLGAGILLVSSAIRLALLPLTLRLARSAREQQRRLAALGPDIDALKRRYADDPAQLMREMRALHAKHDIKLVTPTSLVGFAIQAPLLSGLFSAVRRGLGTKVPFLWIGDLARPDATLMLGIAALTALGIAQTPAAPGQSGPQTGLMVVSVGVTLVVLWSASSAVALSFGASSVVSLLQNWLLSRDAKVTAPNA
jgi:YidC/Oxa1 family membrane protein insertase